MTAVLVSVAPTELGRLVEAKREVRRRQVSLVTGLEPIGKRSQKDQRCVARRLQFCRERKVRDHGQPAASRRKPLVVGRQTRWRGSSNCSRRAKSAAGGGADQRQNALLYQRSARRMSDTGFSIHASSVSRPCIHARLVAVTAADYSRAQHRSTPNLHDALLGLMRYFAPVARRL
jgi:hypothetical protein